MQHEPRLKNSRCSKRELKLCLSRELLGRLSTRWTMSVLTELAKALDRCMRFSELKSRFEGVSQRMLTATLKALERDGLLRRRCDRDHPRGVGSMLTPLSASILLTLEGLISFTMAQWSTIDASRRVYDKRADGR